MRLVLDSNLQHLVSTVPIELTMWPGQSLQRAWLLSEGAYPGIFKQKINFASVSSFRDDIEAICSMCSESNAYPPY